jgi:hypothetical protein
VCLNKRLVTGGKTKKEMEIIRKNLPNVIHNQTFMTITTVMFRQIFVYREADKKYKVEFDCGFTEYYSDPKKVLETIGDEDDVLKVTMTFPSLSEIICVYG